MRRRPSRSPSEPPTSRSAARRSAYASTTHWTSATVAPSSRCSAGRATLTTVPSMKARLEPSTVVASTHGRAASAHGGEGRAARTTPSSHGCLKISASPGEARANVDLRHQRPVHGAAVGDLEEPRSLLVRQRSGELDVALDPVDHPLAGLAFRAVGGVDPRMSQPDRDALERPALASRVECDRHRGAGAQARKQEVVGVGPRVGPAHGGRLVGRQTVRADDDFLREPRGASAHDDLARTRAVDPITGAFAHWIPPRGHAAVRRDSRKSGCASSISARGRPASLSPDRSTAPCSVTTHCTWWRGVVTRVPSLNAATMVDTRVPPTFAVDLRQRKLRPSGAAAAPLTKDSWPPVPEYCRPPIESAATCPARSIDSAPLMLVRRGSCCSTDDSFTSVTGRMRTDGLPSSQR